MTWTWLQKKNPKKETETLFIAAQNNAIRSNYIKAKIDNTLKNSESTSCSDRDETVNHIISKCSILAQKEFKTRHDWVGKVIHQELCKRLKFINTNQNMSKKMRYIKFSET